MRHHFWCGRRAVGQERVRHIIRDSNADTYGLPHGRELTVSADTVSSIFAHLRRRFRAPRPLYHRFRCIRSRVLTDFDEKRVSLREDMEFFHYADDSVRLDHCIIDSDVFRGRVLTVLPMKAVSLQEDIDFQLQAADA